MYTSNDNETQIFENVWSSRKFTQVFMTIPSGEHIFEWKKLKVEIIQFPVCISRSKGAERRRLKNDHFLKASTDLMMN